MTSTTKTTETDDQFTEKRTWRDALASLRDRIAGGDDVDPGELADTRVRADAETEVETAHKKRHQRQMEKEAQEAATVLADELAAKIDPEIHVKGKDAIDAAWENYLATIEATAKMYGDHQRAVDELAAAVRETGVPVVDGKAGIKGDRVVTGRGGRAVPVWRGVAYKFPRVDGAFLPHTSDHSPRAQGITRVY